MPPTSDDWYWEQTWSDFRRGETRIRLSWEGGEASAVLYDAGAPGIVAAILDALPLRVPVVHVAWSGEMVMSSVPYTLGVEQAENEVRLVRPGDLTWDPRYGELAFTYGTAEARLPTGAHTLTVYGAVTDGLDAFAAYGRARRFEGAGEILLERLP
jgi:hypothetical protein